MSTISRAVPASLVLMALFAIAVGKTQDANSVLCHQRCNLLKGVCDPDGQCRCDPGWEGENCDQCSKSAGCVHGTCDQPWQCNCEEGWGGRFCDRDIQYCERHEPCVNGATCVNDDMGGYVCVCADGFTGTNCDVTRQPPTVQSPSRRQNSAYDFSHLCQNGGTCIYGNQIVGCEECACPEGFGGKRCEAFLGMCNTRPCANGGTCRNIVGGFQCECTPGYTGNDCTVDVNECFELQTPACANGGKCSNNVGSYDCECAEGYEGARCEMPKRRMPLIPRLTTTSRKFSPTVVPVTTKQTTFRVTERPEPKYEQPVRPALKKPFETREKSYEEERRIVTNVRVTHVVENLVDAPVPESSASGGQASVSVVQAVTFAFLGVAVALFIGIAAFLWFHCSRKQSQWSRRQCNDAEVSAAATSARPASSVYTEQGNDNRNSVVVVQRDMTRKSRDSGYFKTPNSNFAEMEAGRQCRQPRPGSVVRTLSTSQRPEGGLYVALPQETVRHSVVMDATHLEESRSFLPHARSHY